MAMAFNKKGVREAVNENNQTEIAKKVVNALRVAARSADGVTVKNGCDSGVTHMTGRAQASVSPTQKIARAFDNEFLLTATF